MQHRKLTPENQSSLHIWIEIETVAPQIQKGYINHVLGWVVRVVEMGGSMVERYQKLGLKESLNQPYRYPIACDELSLILRNAYSKVPKNLQSLIFQDSLLAFRLLPE